MDLSIIKKKLDSLNNDSQERVDNSAVFWKPDFGKNNIRVVPSKFDPNNPFTELKFHNAISKYPILALSNFGAQDPVEEFIAKLRETNNKDNWSLSGKISPRFRYFVPVIVRGEEEKGVRLWSLGITTYKALLTLAADDEIGDFTDIVNGTDMIVEKVNGNPYPEITVRARRNSSPLSDDAEQVKKWLNEQPNPIECFRKPDYDYIKGQLQRYLTPDSKSEEQPAVSAETPAATTAQVVEEKQKPVEVPVAQSPATKVPPKSTTAKFNELFGDDDDI